MIIYELEADYSHYLEALGAPARLVRRYAYRNALLPQITGLALALGAVLAGALVTEVVFNYPGVGSLVLTAIQNRDYFLLQGIFLFIIVGVLIANFIVDIAYVLDRPAHAHRHAGAPSSGRSGRPGPGRRRRARRDGRERCRTGPGRAAGPSHPSPRDPDGRPRKQFSS